VWTLTMATRRVSSGVATPAAYADGLGRARATGAGAHTLRVWCGTGPWAS